MLAPVALMVLSTLSAASAHYSYGWTGGYGGYNGGYNGGNFIGGPGGACGNSYAGIQYGGYYKRSEIDERGVSEASSVEERDATDGDVEKRSDSDIMKRTFGNGGLCCAIFGCFCSNYEQAPAAPIYVCVDNYPHPYPVQGGWPSGSWTGSGCGCDGYAVDWNGNVVPHYLPADFQFFGHTGWTAPAKAPSGNFVPTAETAKALARAHWYNPAQSHALALANTTAPAAAKAPGSARAMHRRRV
ncbi:hypothetical protein RQP46_005617 [Phenoliferia psychrophenolica]